MKVSVFLSIGYPAAVHREVLELPDDATDEEIQAEAEDWKNNYIEWSYERLYG
jgi:hypothetical protein